MGTIGIICACKSELTPFLAQLKNQAITERSMLTFYEGDIGKAHVAAVLCGICKVNAALAAQVLIDTFHPDAVINSGTAGGMDPAVRILDTVIAARTAYHDVENGILTEEHPHMDSVYFESDPALLALAKAYCQNQPALENLFRAAGLTKEQGPPKVLFGTMVTGEQFIEDDLREEINSRFAPLSVDMETAGIAHACYVNKVPFLAVRTITDTAEHKGLQTYSRNSHKAGEIAAGLVMELLQRLEV